MTRSCFVCWVLVFSIASHLPATAGEVPTNTILQAVGQPGMAYPTNAVLNPVSIVVGSPRSACQLTDGTWVSWKNDGVPNWNDGDLTNAVKFVPNQCFSPFEGIVYEDGSVKITSVENQKRIDVPTSALSNVVDLAFTRETCFALTKDGILLRLPLVWNPIPGSRGYVLTNSLTLPPSSNIVSVVGSYEHAAGVTADGQVLTWGSNGTSGYWTPPAGLKPVRKVVASQNFLAALCNDGTIQAWGYSTNTPPGTNWIDIACGSATLVGVRDDGTAAMLIPPADSPYAYIYGFGWASQIEGLRDVRTVAPVENCDYSSSSERLGLLFASSQPLLTAGLSSSTFIEGGTGVIHAPVAAANPYEAEWLFDGNLIPGAGQAQLMLDHLSYTNSGNYRFTATGSDGFQTTAIIKVQVYAGNDNFADAKAIPATGGQFGDVTIASAFTREPGEPNHAGGSGGSLWYKWTPTADGTVVVRTKDTSIDTVLAVYTGTTLTNLQLVAADDDAGIVFGDYGSMVTFSAKSGTEYWIALGTYGSLPSQTQSAIFSWLLYYQTPMLTITRTNPLLLSVSGDPTVVPQVQASENLIDWVTLQSTPIPVGNAQVFQVPTAQGSCRFFRLR